MMRIAVAAFCGVLFGIGLAVSGMTDTRVVLGFLDIAGSWNPALLWVMVGALDLKIPGFRLVKTTPAPLLDHEFHLPQNCRIEARPIVGSIIFGVGWGLYGYCPGPALASILSMNWQPLLFVVAMAAGMRLEKALFR